MTTNNFLNKNTVKFGHQKSSSLWKDNQWLLYIRETWLVHYTKRL